MEGPERKGAGIGMGGEVRVPAESAVADTATATISCAFLSSVQPFLSSAAAVEELRICF